MTMTPDEIRDMIIENCEDLEGSKLSQGFYSLMEFLDVDTLVKWFYEEVCCLEPADYFDEEKAKFLNDYYNRHCQ